jgi:CPA2 family monovalent cation:H+ antiporter-2
MFEGGIVKDLLIVLAVAGVVVPLFGRLRFGVVPGFLLAGVIVGPGGLGAFAGEYPWLAAVTFSDPDRVRPFAELGVLFLLFLIGLGLSLERLWAMRRLVVGLGSAQVLTSAAAIALVAAWYGNGFALSVALGLGFALSSTAIVTQVLIESRRLALPAGRAAFSVLLVQDLLVVPIVIVVGLLGGDGVAVPGAVLGAFGLAALVVAAIVAFGRLLVRPLMQLAARTGHREAVVAIAVFLAVGMGVLTASVGLSAALGAFLAGLLLGESEFRHQIEVDVDPFKAILLGVFFMSVGMSIEPSVLAAGWPLIVASAVVLLLVKGALVAALALAFGLGAAVAAEAALLLAGAGEFAFVVLQLARNVGLLASAPHQFFVTVATLSMLAIPALGALGRRLGGAIAHRGADRSHGPDAAAGFADHVVIGGFGRVGRMVAGVLDAERIPYVALDLDAAAVRDERAAGRPVFYGDASRREMLDRVGGARARAFVVTTDAEAAGERMVRAIRAAWPDARIHARARDRSHALRLIDIGADTVVPEALEASLQLAGRVLAGEGVPEAAVDARLAIHRDAEVARIGRDDEPSAGGNP